MDWFENIALPLHAAIDEATELPDSASIDDRWAFVLKQCPWIMERGLISVKAGPPRRTYDPDWNALKSSNLDAYRFVDRGLLGVLDLYIRFKDGNTYVYSDVPIEKINGLAAAESPGSYLAKEIRPEIVGIKINTDDAGVIDPDASS